MQAPSCGGSAAAPDRGAGPQVGVSGGLCASMVKVWPLLVKRGLILILILTGVCSGRGPGRGSDRGAGSASGSSVIPGTESEADRGDADCVA